jgi:hypothetical protein
VRRRGAAVEQAGLGEEERPRADRTDAPRASGHPAQPAEHGLVFQERIDAEPAHHEQGVDPAAQRTESRIGEEPEPGRSGDRLLTGAHHRDRVPGMRPALLAQDAGRPGEQLERTREVQGLHSGVDEQRDAQRAGGRGGAFHGTDGAPAQPCPQGH